MFERIYHLSQNFERDRFRIFAHLVEVTGGLTQASIKLGDYARATEFLAKVFAWQAALLKAIDHTDLESIVWGKFPRICPYCRAEICACGTQDGKPALDGEAVRDAALRRHDTMPADLFEWQLMFDRIYAQRAAILSDSDPQARARAALFEYSARFIEELGEVSEAMRLEYFYPHHLRNEVADVFAWTCGIANILPLAFGREEPLFLADLVWETYPNRCPHCRDAVCTCRIEPVRDAISQAGVYAGSGVDRLTGAQLRERFDADLEHLLANAGAEAIGLIMFDCDDFKQFNDATDGGHDQGDEVLRVVASTASKALGERGTLYRFGGDEFTVLVDQAHLDDLERIRLDVVAAVESQPISDVVDSSKTHYAAISAACVAGDNDDDAENLRRRADAAMYENKRSRKAERIPPPDRS
jgi:diguanylate cyclase (GGDEF)-like protein